MDLCSSISLSVKRDISSDFPGRSLMKLAETGALFNYLRTLTQNGWIRTLCHDGLEALLPFRQTLDWCTPDDLKKMSDLMIFVYGSNRGVYAMSQTRERMIPQCFIPTAKHDGGNFQAWECFASSGVGQLHLMVSTSGPKKTKQSWLSYTSLHSPIEHL